MIYAIHRKVLIALLSLLFAVNSPPTIAEDLPNPYKLDLREATEKQKKGAIAYASKLRVTIVIFSESEAVWKIIKDVGRKFASRDIPINIAWAKDNDGNVQTAKIIIFADGQARESIILSTKLGYLNYDAMVENKYVKTITDITMEINREFFYSP